MELNHRPHAYQACALTKLSYRPFLVSEQQSVDSNLKCFRMLTTVHRPLILDPSKLNSNAFVWQEVSLPYKGLTFIFP
jgi:hypothetical protein